MPIYKPEEICVYYPQSDYPIVKYMDLIKFISLLSNKRLFFCRLDKLEDKLEGKMPKKNKQAILNFLKYQNERLNYGEIISEEVLDKQADEYINEPIMPYAFTLVNCWNKYNNESAALWKIYSDNGKGIMIKTSVNSVVKSLEKTPEEIAFSEVKYIDHDKEETPIGNIYYRIIHKSNAFHYEDEIRLIYLINKSIDCKEYWEKERIKEGHYIALDIDILIHEIIIGPYSPKWIIDLIMDICSQYHFTKKISLSKLT